jgi:spermidine synthase
MIGILITIFMAGIALGSIFMTAGLKRNKNELRLFIGLEALIVAFSFVTALTITRFLWSAYYTALIFIALFFISGLLLGLEFPLASKIYIREKKEVGRTAGVLYSADLIGGWVAGIVGSIVLLPVLGLFNTCLIIVMFKLSSLFLLLTSRKGLTGNII